MTLDEIKNLTDSQIRQYGLESLYKRKALSNTNMDCYLMGFKKAAALFSTDVHQVLDDCITSLDVNIKDIEDSAGYSGRCLKDDEMKHIRKVKQLRQILIEAVTYMTEEKFNVNIKLKCEL